MDTDLAAFLARVTERAGYDGPQQAVQAVRIVLEVLGAHLVGDDRTELARLLPEQCGPLLTHTEPASTPLTPASFIEAVADRSEGSTGDARRKVDAVLPTLAEVADKALLRRVLTQLPPGHAELFHCADPV
ncbi:DUF2267 domain-containing protein [Streptomyces seoulensis]